MLEVQYMNILFIHSILQAVTDEQRQTADKVAKECAGESGLSVDDVQKLRTDPKSLQKDPKAQVNSERKKIDVFK